ncbi:LicD family protein [Nocardioides alcanivorans]|uniref:LicD family protein n=1 Tax=Nocardioides alcanivorans TaxID=2897352 RepID=UPI001F385306|nr:LicD family protein [Nocardioides alcanivorans]
MRLRPRLGRLRRSSGPSAHTPTVSGIVEQFTPKRVIGWVSVPADTPQLPVELYVGPHLVSATHPTADVPLSGFELAREDGSSARPRRRGRGPTAGRRDDRRNSGQQVRVFSFQIQGLWNYLGRNSRLTVRFDGQRLPIAGHGMWLNPRHAGERTVEDLVALLESGHKLSKSGILVPPLERNEEWSVDVAGLFQQTRAILEKRGLEPFLIYGSLLGHVRDGGPISHDNDFDCAYVSGFNTGEEVADELVEIALELRRAGLVVDLRHRLLHIHDPESGRRIDLFHSWFDEEGRYRITWGWPARPPSSLTTGRAPRK